MSKILIADDADFLRVRLWKMLSAEGHEIFEAEDGLRAVEQYKSHSPDVTLMDITMPEMDGLTALKEIQAFDPNAKVIMITAFGQESEVLEAIKSAARDFVMKPFERERLLLAINKLLKPPRP